MSDELLTRLIDSLRVLPGVGPRSAQRMALHLLERDRAGGRRLAADLTLALERIGHCEVCRNFTEQDVCALCRNPQRDDSVLCIVETPADVLAIEQAGVFSGRYFVLLGRLSPLDGIGPEDLGFDLLEKRLATGTVREVVIATNATVEGEATAWYLHEMARRQGLVVSRIAHGVPLGGELEQIDRSTLALAFTQRLPLDKQG